MNSAWKTVVAVAALAAAPVHGASPAAGTADLVGTWRLVSETAHKDGTTSEPLGSHPVGSMMFDRGGRFMLLIARPGLPRFAAGRRDAGTAEENRAVLGGLLAFIGTYTVDDAGQVLTLHVEAGTFPNWVGAGQKRSFRLRGDQMIWTNRSPAIGAAEVEVVWRRAP